MPSPVRMNVPRSLVRWTEYGLNALTFSLVGVTLVLTGVAVLFGDRFPRWLGRGRSPPESATASRDSA